VSTRCRPRVLRRQPASGAPAAHPPKSVRVWVKGGESDVGYFQNALDDGWTATILTSLASNSQVREMKTRTSN
jgi:hypothetical protein